ncbi:MAG: endonuclease [Clostridia bacterium]|nr:endonuclease [Clostridia bacterium]
MKVLKKISIVLALFFVAIVPTAMVKADAAVTPLLGTPTGYTQASDVDYTTSGSYIVNWGAREEDCKFLSTYAESFYTGNYTYASLSQKKGGTSKSDAPKSNLYSALKTLMKDNHKKETSYSATRDLYKYTDCVNSNSNKISSFYSGKELSGTWDSGKTWNREHTWPNSKGLGGNDENDIMMLRPTWVQENSSRGNTAYGQSSGYYDPNGEGDGKVNLRGDCARIVLYVYVRWGNTNSMWGNSGVMESVDVLLQWMEEDPVDTWEMGRNDAVQSITGTRNVFVDYPEFAWQLFGEVIPENMSTPSGMANNGQGGNTGGNDSSSDVHEHKWSDWTVVTQPTETQEGSQKRVCACGEEEWETIAKLENGGSSDNTHEHNYSKWITVKEATETENGEKRRTCLSCGETDVVTVFPNGDEHRFTDWEIVKEATETERGFKSRTCTDENCGYHDMEVIPKLESNPNTSDSESGFDSNSLTAVGCESAIISGSSLISVAIFLGCAIVCKKGKKE